MQIFFRSFCLAQRFYLNWSLTLKTKSCFFWSLVFVFWILRKYRSWIIRGPSFLRRKWTLVFPTTPIIENIIVHTLYWPSTRRMGGIEVLWSKAVSQYPCHIRLVFSQTQLNNNTLTSTVVEFDTKINLQNKPRSTHQLTESLCVQYGSWYINWFSLNCTGKFPVLSLSGY